MGTMHLKAAVAIGIFWIGIGGTALAQSTVTVTVPGTSNPYLAGMPNGTTCCKGDSAPAESPVEVTGIQIKAKEALNFSASGLCSESGPDGLYPPDGAAGFFVTPPLAHGISAINAPVCALVGVFLGSQKPGRLPAPPAADFTVSPGLNFAGLSPGLQEVFFIGDGLTDTGAAQQFIVPSGATRLYLGVVDGSGWFNNGGSFTVVITIQ